MSAPSFKGTGIAIVTPFRDDKSIDFKALGKLIQYWLANGIDYLVVLGTTGEAVTLTNDEKSAVVDFVIENVDGKLPIVVGVGGNNTMEVVKHFKEYDFDKITGVLSVGPYYNKPNQTGFYEHFKRIASESPVPVILYNVPGRTGSTISAETTLKLAHDFKNIAAIKEASGNFELIMQIIKDKPERFQVISGDDLLTLPIISIGGEGVISVVANAFPKEMAEMVNLALANKMKQARQIHFQLMDITRALFTEGSPAGVKAVLNQLKIGSNNLRLPLTPVSKAHFEKLAELVKKMKS
jgi:4-hydroxy-tetrahydrodipicolinate synthase